MRHLRIGLVAILASAAGVLLTAQAKPPLGDADIGAIAQLVMLEDTRNFDEAVLSSLLKSQHPEVRRRVIVAVGRIIGAPAQQPPPPQPPLPPKGSAVLAGMRSERDPEILATVAWATGQLRDPANVPWLAHLLSDSQTPAVAAKEAAGALGKIQSPDARTALANYLSSAPTTAAAADVVGEALLAIGRQRRDDLAPVLRWMTSTNVEVRWRATWALFRLRDPSAFSALLKLADDPSAEVRYWAVRGLAPIPPPAQRGRAAEPAPPADPAPDPALVEKLSARLRAALKDPDRRVRTEALRALGGYDDDASFQAVLGMIDSPDAWVSVTAAEVLATKASRADVVVPKLVAAAAPAKPLALRHTVLAPLVTMAPDRAVDIAAALARSKSIAVRTAALQALGARLGEAGKAKLAEISVESVQQTPPPAPPERTLADYRRIVERWIVPDYKGAPRPRATWTFPRGVIEIELFPGDAPLATDYFVALVESGAIVGTEFGRLVPNFVAQQRTIAGALRLRDEVNRRGLTRANLSWASAGLDTGRPGYTLGNTPQPHNEGNFTALGRVVRGMDVVDRLEFGDAVTATRMIRK